jgi:hypothetical protein
MYDFKAAKLMKYYIDPERGKVELNTLTIAKRFIT